MSFTSVLFFVFFAAVVAAWYLVPKRYARFVLLAASLFFYALFGVKALAVMLSVTLFTFVGGLIVKKSENKKTALAAFLVPVLGSLLCLKYLGFFASAAGMSIKLSLAAPVGMSFFTLTCAGYLIDIYRGKYPPERDIVSFALFVCFFPQILSGPIPRGASLLPQINDQNRQFRFESARDGAALFAWGVFMKLLVADNLGAVVSYQYRIWANADGIRLLIASFLFGIQIYCDFAAYTNMARGLAKILSLELPENFERPYFSRSIKEFWRRWHISLSNWFRDYLYIPLGGSRRGTVHVCFNTLVVFLASGLWHGASWNFVAWGGLHGLWLVLSNLTEKPRTTLKNKLHIMPNGFWERFVRPALTFLGVDFLWIFFNAPSLSAAVFIIKTFFTVKEVPYYIMSTLGIPESSLWVCLAGALIVFAYDLIIEKKPELFKRIPASAKTAAVWLLLLSVLFFGYAESSSFIYFKF